MFSNDFECGDVVPSRDFGTCHAFFNYSYKAPRDLNLAFEAADHNLYSG
jgi:hypothetical protein